MTEQFSVILNLFQDLITQKLEGRQLKPTDVKKSGGQASLEGRKIRRYEGRLFSVNSLSSNPPTLLPSTNHSGGNASLIPPYGLLNLFQDLITQKLEGRQLKPTDVKKSGGQASLEGKKIRRYEGKLFSVNSLSSNPPTLLSFLNNVRHTAFTLAEVLITLGIIGIVAAMTMPAVIAKFQHKALETAFNKTYSSLMQAVLYADPESIPDITGGGVVGHDSEFFQKLWEKYNVAVDLVKAGGIYTPTNIYKSEGSIMTYNKKSNANVECAQVPTFVVADGTAVGGMYNCAGMWISIDINGPYKKPNALGHDIFYFSIDNENRRLFPLGTNKVVGYWNFSNKETYCSRNSSNVRNGFGCAVFALQNKCPDDDTKTYWECLP